MVAEVSARPRYASGLRSSRPSLTFSAAADSASPVAPSPASLVVEVSPSAEVLVAELPVPSTSTVPLILTGGLGADTLVGGAGNDVLSGGAGGDTLIGGPGNDAYIVDRTDDRPIEQAQQGHDTIWAMVDWTLGAHLEDLVFLGSTGKTGYGNDLANLVQGTGGADNLHGGGGDDALLGGAGADALYGDAGADLLQGGLGDDRLQGGPGQDRLIGGAGADRFVIERGDGADQIETEYDPDPDPLTAIGDSLILGANIAHDQLWFSYAEGDLWIRVLGGGQDSVQVLRWSAANPQALSHVVAGDGLSLHAGRIGLMVQAMAATPAPQTGATVLTDQQLACIAATSSLWHL